MKRDLLLVIDMQNVYGKGGQWYCKNSETAAMNIKALIEQGGSNMDIIFTRFVYDENASGVWQRYNQENEQVNHDAYGNELMDILKPLAESYPVYDKSRYSSLSNDEVLSAVRNSDRVVVSGVVSECCVLSTVMGIIDEGVPVIYLTDATAGIDDETERAVELVLSGLMPLHVQLMTKEQYLQEQI